MAVLVVEEKNSGIVAVAPPIEGKEGGGLGGWGVYNPAIHANLNAIAGRFAPLLDAALRAGGGVNIANLFAEGLLMGDEEHTRQAATDKLFLSQLLPGVLAMEAPAEEKLALLEWIASCRRFVHHAGCASAVASLKSAAGVPEATLVTAMCGNGVEFGVKVSGQGERWFTAPAPTFSGFYFSPEHSDADAAPWLGRFQQRRSLGIGRHGGGGGPGPPRRAGRNPRGRPCASAGRWPESVSE